MSKKEKSKKRKGRKNNVMAEEQVYNEPSPSEFLNREIQWLEFNARVLDEAGDSRNPLLERVKFLSIFTSNLDEFFMKRVGGLQRQIYHKIHALSGDGLSPEQQIQLIRKRTMPLLQQQSSIWRKDIVPALKSEGIHFKKFSELSKAEQKWARQYFRSTIFPVLTPLSVDPGHPFPFISNLSVSLAVTLVHPDREDEPLFARLKIPKVFPSFVQIADSDKVQFISLIDLITENIDELFPSMIVQKVMPFRITRNADIDREEEDAEDLLEMMTEELKQRRFADVVRLEHGPVYDSWMLDLLMEELELTAEDIFEVDELLDFTDLKMIADRPDAQLHDHPWKSVAPVEFSDESLFQKIKDHDVLVHHPYESFAQTVLKFIEAAARDPKVLAIKMTLYRTGDDSPIIPLLIEAAESGKQVVCLIELKARFDEQRNILWAQKLEEAGVHVVYGLVGYKTHCKTLLVVRQEDQSLRSYAHIGTGNYHSGTSRFYTDVGLFTSRPEITDQVVHLFHFLTGRSLKADYSPLLVAPISMKRTFLSLIERETAHAKQGQFASIVAKMNSLEDIDICRALYRASQAGVQIQLIVRGFCCLRPQVVGLSDNIRVYSILGRYLEHSRIFYFANGQKNRAEGEFYLGSADWMYRNLHARVEVVTPVLDKLGRERLSEILDVHLNDLRQSWEMDGEGQYRRRGSYDLPNEEGSHWRLTQMTLTQNAELAMQASERGLFNDRIK